jgi:hypothetical protein
VLNICERITNRMKSIYLMIGLVSILPIQSNAGEMVPTEMYCTTTKELAKDLKEKYKEIPLLVGKTMDEAKTVMSFWVNQETKSWSIIATKGEYSCLVGAGENFSVLKRGTPI